MPISHSFVSAIPDGADATLVRPSDWNADHVGESAGVVPLGGIIMWSGAIAAIPTDWALCDGTANAPGPDLRDKFIVGATSDQGGIAKTNIEGSLKQSGGVTGHSHSGHANLTHAGGAVGDHTGLTHGLTIADHPDLTHPALSHAASTFSHADHSVASFSGTNASHAAISVPSGSVTIASGTHSHAAATLTPTLASLNTGVLTTPTAATRGTLSATTLTVGIGSFSGTHASQTGSIASVANASAPTLSHSHAASTLTHADHSFPSLSHQAIGTHKGTDYGVHTFTAPAAHGTAGTLTHSFTQPNDHAISAHDTVLSLPNYFALAFIQRMA